MLKNDHEVLETRELENKMRVYEMRILKILNKNDVYLLFLFDSCKNSIVIRVAS